MHSSPGPWSWVKRLHSIVIVYQPNSCFVSACIEGVKDAADDVSARCLLCSSHRTSTVLVMFNSTSASYTSIFVMLNRLKTGTIVAVNSDAKSSPCSRSRAPRICRPRKGRWFERSMTTQKLIARGITLSETQRDHFVPSISNTDLHRPTVMMSINFHFCAASRNCMLRSVNNGNPIMSNSVTTSIAVRNIHRYDCRRVVLARFCESHDVLTSCRQTALLANGQHGIMTTNAAASAKAHTSPHSALERCLKYFCVGAILLSRSANEPFARKFARITNVWMARRS